MPASGCEDWEPLDAGWDAPEVPAVCPGVGALELLDVLEVAGEGELWVEDGGLTDGVLTDGVLTDGVLTDGVLTEGVLTEGTGNDEESAGCTAIAVIAPKTPAATDATNSFLPLDTA